MRRNISEHCSYKRHSLSVNFYFLLKLFFHPFLEVSASTEGTSSIWPTCMSCSLNIATSTSFASQSFCNDCTAANPAACPMLIVCAIERQDACASCVAEKQRPIIHAFKLPFG